MTWNNLYEMSKAILNFGCCRNYYFIIITVVILLPSPWLGLYKSQYLWECLEFLWDRRGEENCQWYKHLKLNVINCSHLEKMLSCNGCSFCSSGNCLRRTSKLHGYILFFCGVFLRVCLCVCGHVHASVCVLVYKCVYRCLCLLCWC